MSHFMINFENFHNLTTFRRRKELLYGRFKRLQQSLVKEESDSLITKIMLHLTTFFNECDDNCKIVKEINASRVKKL